MPQFYQTPSIADLCNQQKFLITVDSDTSTSDLFSDCHGAAANTEIEDPDPRLAEFRHAGHVMQDLATQIVRDGEGASKFITIEITGARTDAPIKSLCPSPIRRW